VAGNKTTDVSGKLVSPQKDSPRPFDLNASQTIVDDNRPLELFAEHVGADIGKDCNIAKELRLALRIRANDGRDCGRIETAFHELWRDAMDR
jgi:hypothetical protein